MNRSGLVEALAHQFKQLTSADAKAATDTIIEAIMAALASGGRVEIRGFGVFSLRYRQEKLGRNPSTGAEVQIPAKAVSHFKMGKELQERVDRRQ